MTSRSIALMFIYISSFILIFVSVDAWENISIWCYVNNHSFCFVSIPYSVIEIRRNVIINPESFSDNRSNIRNVISEILTWEIRNISYFEQTKFWYPKRVLSEILTTFQICLLDIRKVFRICYDASNINFSCYILNPFEQKHNQNNVFNVRISY